MKSKVFQIKGRKEHLTDEEVIRMIKEGLLTADDQIITADLKDYIKIKDTIYQFYLKGEEK